MKIKLVNSKEELLRHGRVCGVAFQNSTLKKKIIPAFEDITEEKSKDLRGKFHKTPHTSVFEFVDFTFLLEDVSLVVELFLIQYRLASFNIKSRRYVNFEEQGYYTPKLNFSKIGVTEEEKEEAYRIVKEQVEKRFKSYSKLVEDGENVEDARYILPLCLNSNIIMKMNGTEIYKMISDGIYSSEIKEIEEFCEEIRTKCADVFPEMFEKIENPMTPKEVHFEKGVDVLNFQEKDVEFINLQSDNFRIYEVLSGCKTENYEVANFSILNRMRKNKKINEFISITEGSNDSFSIRLSVASFTHLVRHRMQSVLTIPLNRWGYMETKNIRSDKENFKEIIKENDEFKSRLLELGVSKSDLIYFMLSGDYIIALQSLNLREFIHISNLRLCKRAQSEIRRIVAMQKNMIRGIGTMVSDYINPKCVTEGNCKENKKC